MSEPSNKSFKQLLMPGPQFGKITRRSRWQRYSLKIFLAVVIILIAAGFGYFYQDLKNRQAVLQPVIEDLRQQVASPPAKPSAPDTSVNANTPQVSQQNSDLVVTLAKGNGRTHAARAALKEYLKDKPELKNKLRPEHLIYLEDLIQKQTPSPQVLHPGDTITFSANTMANALNNAQQLTNAQLNNLSKYVPLVPSLMTP